MPRRRTTKRSTALQRRRVYRRGMRGKGFMSFLKKANRWLRKTKVLSTVGKALGAAGVPHVGKYAGMAGKLGYGRRRRVVRRRRRGRGLRLAGSGLGLAGGRKKKMYPRGIAF